MNGCEATFKLREHLPTGSSWKDLELERAKRTAHEYVESIAKVVVADCDGILTDSKSVYTADGKFSKTYGAYDKEAMDFMIALGWRFIFVTSDKAGASITNSRLEHLEKMDPTMISHSVAGPEARYKLVENLMSVGNKVLFVGDSLSDIETLNIATWAATTRNAPETVKRYCECVSFHDGGNGGFADILFAIHYKILEDGKM